MANHDINLQGERRSRSLAWLYMPIFLIIFLGGALSIAAYNFNETDLTMAESVAAGFGGLAALIVALIAAAISIVVGLAGALIGLVAAGGALAVTLFIVASPIIAIVLMALLWRRSRTSAHPDAGGHPAA